MCGMCQLVLDKDDCVIAEPEIEVASWGVTGDLRTIMEVFDAASNASTAYVMEVGDVFEGELESGGDWDWIAIDLTEGQAIQVTMDGNVFGGVSDTVLSIFGLGNYLAGNDDFNGQLNVSQVTFVAPETNTYYIVADSFGGVLTGNYTISVIETEAPGLLESIQQTTALDDTSIDVWFADAGYFTTAFDSTITAEAWNSYEIGQFEEAFDLIESVTNVSFNVVSSEAQADFIYVLDTNGDFSALGAHEFPDNNGTQTAIYNGASWDRDPDGDLEAGGYGFVTIVHEVLHGLGLAHPHDDGGGTFIMNGVSSAYNDYGNSDLNQGIWSTMSYNTGWPALFGSGFVGDLYGMEAGPMALDIAALQALYGAAANNTGNTTYYLPDSNSGGTSFSAIWDSGGTDTIVNDTGAGAIIHLGAATLEYEDGGGGFVSYIDGIQGGFTIANGVVIENATGGSASDDIFGNDAANEIRGNGGEDNIYGGGGADNIMAGTGDDIVYGGDGINRLIGNRGNDQLFGGDERDVIIGGGQQDSIYGNDGNDALKGHRNGDLIYGGEGTDVIRGNRGGDEIYGGGDNDTIYAGGENDLVDGGRGNDTLFGGNGADEFWFDGNDGMDEIGDFNVAVDELYLQDTLLNGGTVQDLVDNAVVNGDGVLLDFGGGNSVLITNLSSTAGLVDTIETFVD